MNIKKQLWEKICFIKANFKLKKSAEWDGILIEWFGSTDYKDCDSDIVKYSAWDNKTIKKFLENPQMLLGHDMNKSIRKWTKLERRILNDKKGLWVEWSIEHDIEEDGIGIKERIKKGTVRTLSIGFEPIKYKWFNQKGQVIADETGLKKWFKYEDVFAKWVVRYISKVNLLEISVVNIPANSQAIFALKKSLELNRYFILKEFKPMTTKFNINVLKGRRTKESMIAIDEIMTEVEAIESIIDETKEIKEVVSSDLLTVATKIEQWINEDNAKVLVSELETYKQDLIDAKTKLEEVESVLASVDIESMIKDLSDADAIMVEEKMTELTNETKEEIAEFDKVLVEVEDYKGMIWVNPDESSEEVKETIEEVEKTDETTKETSEWQDEVKETTEWEETKTMEEWDKEETKTMEEAKEDNTEVLKTLIKEVLDEYFADKAWNKSDESSELTEVVKSIAAMNDKIEKLSKGMKPIAVVPSTNDITKAMKIDTKGLKAPISFSKKR